MITDPLFYLAAIPAVILTGLAKGGLSGISVLSVPLLTMVVSPVQGAAIMLPILLLQDVVSVWAFRRTIDWRNVSILIPGAAIGVTLGYLLAAKMPDALIALIVGLIAIIFGARRFYLDTRRTPPLPKPAKIGPGLFWGACTGFTSMISHAGGPPFQVYVLPQKLSRDVFVGTSAVVFAIVNWLKVPPYIVLGQMNSANMATAAVLFPLAFASTWAGVFVTRRIGGKAFYMMVYILLMGIGVKLIYSAGRDLWQPVFHWLAIVL